MRKTAILTLVLGGLGLGLVGGVAGEQASTHGAITPGTSAAPAAREWTWKGKGDAFTRDKAGGYVWWNFGLRLPPGQYRLFARLRGDGRAAFTLQAVDSTSGKTFWQNGLIPGADYAEHDFGAFAYDGCALRISDWNQPGFYVESLRLVLLEAALPPPDPANTADRLDGWIPLRDSTLAIDEATRKEGSASLRVSVKGDAAAKWYDRGAMRRLRLTETKRISFWLRFDGEPRRFWVQLVTPEGNLARPVDPSEPGLKAGEWRFVELPVAGFHVKPARTVARDVQAVVFSPHPDAADCVFRLDDILLE